MRTFTIELRTAEECADGSASRFDIVDDEGRRCDGLGFDELLGQVTSLCHPKLGTPQYRMQTAEQWQQEREQQVQRFAQRRAEKAEAPQLMLDALRQWRQAEQTDDPREYENAQRARDEAIAKATAT